MTRAVTAGRPASPHGQWRESGRARTTLGIGYGYDDGRGRENGGDALLVPFRCVSQSDPCANRGCPRRTYIGVLLSSCSGRCIRGLITQPKNVLVEDHTDSDAVPAGRGSPPPPPPRRLSSRTGRRNRPCCPLPFTDRVSGRVPRRLPACPHQTTVRRRSRVGGIGRNCAADPRRSHRPTVLFSQAKPTTSNQPPVKRTGRGRWRTHA